MDAMNETLVRHDFDLTRDGAILERTPAVLTELLRGLPSEWTDADDGPGTWSARVVLAHLIHGERTDWIPRARIIVQRIGDRRFPPFDRDGNIGDAERKSVDALLAEFSAARSASLRELDDLRITPQQLDWTGVHPEFGEVPLRQHLATWVAHDLGHLVQISRTMARRLRGEVGPWRRYLSVMGTPG
jgi:hypothetical protein